VTRGQLPQRAGSLGLTAVGLPPRYPHENDDGLFVGENLTQECTVHCSACKCDDVIDVICHSCEHYTDTVSV